MANVKKFKFPGPTHEQKHKIILIKNNVRYPSFSLFIACVQTKVLARDAYVIVAIFCTKWLSPESQ